MARFKSGSNLEKVFLSGTLAVTGELGPPKSADRKVIAEKADILKGYVDAVNITDCQTAIVRTSSIASAAILMERGLEPIVQMTCRDRNRIAIQSDILGAAALGVKNLLCLTGDHQSFGNHPEAKNVFDLDSVHLVSCLKNMRDKKIFINGEKMDVAPKMFIGAVENPFADPFEIRAPRVGKKVAAGADFFQTQIIYNVPKFKKWMKQVRDLGLHKKAYIMAGVAPLKSAGMARYMKNFVPGMDVPDEYIERMVEAKDPKDEGINVCVDIINQVKKIEGVAGVHIMAIEWEEAVPVITERAKLLPRPTL
ncbi:MAG: methylenetetrahydrofolate reductase [Actinobacteria bacterium]|nr:MAG: methylenetetrahydrofolate reductase [Actinomycetota bacterium]